MVGLALSALARTSEQIMPLLVVAVMSQLVFSGGMIPVTGRLVLDQLSWFTPARWGFAASASTVDLIKLVPGPLTPEGRALGAHRRRRGGSTWRMLAAISIGYSDVRALEDPAQSRVIPAARVALLYAYRE